MLLPKVNININNMVREPYFSILVIVVLLLFLWTAWGTKDRLIIDGMVGAGAADTFALAPNLAGGTAASTLTVTNTSLLIKPDGVLFLTLPPEMTGITKTDLTLTPSTFGTIDGVFDACETEDIGEMIESSIKSGAAVTRCSATKIKIIMTTPVIIASPPTENAISFAIAGLKIPAASPNPLTFSIESSANERGDVTPGVTTLATIRTSTAPVTFATGSSATTVDRSGDLAGCTFNIKLSDDTPKAKSVTVNYGFAFTAGAAAASPTFKIKSGSKMYFIFSDDFDLPTITNIKVVLNKNTVLDSEKGEYSLVYKTKCGTPSKNVYSALPGFSTANKLSDTFDSSATLCAKYYMLTLNRDVDVTPTEPLTMSLVGITNPSYYSPPAASEKRDYLIKPFNMSICLMQLSTVMGTTAGKYFINPTPDSYANAGVYFRGNYPIKNKTGASDADDDDGDSNSSKKSSTSSNHAHSHAHAASVYTVNYFYDGQGVGEYGHIAQPEIFGSRPYSHGGGSGSGASSSDKYIAKHYRDLAEQKRRQDAATSGQLIPPLGVAPATLNGGVQPYNSEIHF